MIGSLSIPAAFRGGRKATPSEGLGRERFDIEQDPFDLTRRFLLLGLAVIAAVSVVSSVLLSRYLAHEWLLRDAYVSARFIERSVLQRHSESYFSAERPGPSPVKL